nr:MAG TPA: hypothetical protein [Caudoviricetes sp.]
MSIFYTNKTITMNRGDSGVVLLSILNRDDTPFALPIGMKNPTIVFSVKAETDANDLNSNMLIEEYMPIEDYTYYGYGTQNADGQMRIHGGFYPKSKTVNTEESVLDTGIIYKVLANKKYMFVVPTTTPPVYPIGLTKREYAFAVPLVFEPAFTDRLSPGTYTYSITLLDSTSPIQFQQGEGENATMVTDFDGFLKNVTLKQDLFGPQKLILSDSPIARVHGEPIRRIYYIKPCSEESVTNATANEITTGNVTSIALPPVYIATAEQLGGIIVGQTLQVDFRGVLNVSTAITNKIADLYAKIGDMTQLTTEHKDTLVGAINEVDAHADANKAEIGDRSELTTDEKATLVGAINEVDKHTDDAQNTADNATTLANTGISKAEQAQSTANTAVDKANDAKATAEEAIMKADGRSNSIGFMTAKDAVAALNGYPRNQLKGGDTIWIVEAGTPDLWVTEVAQESVPYNYTTKDKFNQDLVDNTVLQIGYFKTAYQESDGKPVTIAWQNVSIKTADWVASTEFADFPYEAKIELTDFVDYKTVPQVVFDIADTMSGNYAPICKSGDKCVYIYGKTQDEITLKTVITFAPNVNGASVVGGGYNNRGKWVASTTYEIDDLVYTDKGQYVCIEGITSTTSPDNDTTHWQATFVATAGTTKNVLNFVGRNKNDTNVLMAFDGAMEQYVSFNKDTFTVEKTSDDVLEISVKGTVPKALPQEASALKSGNLPTSGWESTNVSWTGNVTSPANYDYLRFVTNIAGSYATNEIFYKTTYDNLLKSATVKRTGNGPIGNAGSSHASTQTGDYKLYAEENNAHIHIVIYDNGNIYYSCQHGSGIGTYALTELSVASSRKTYSISDTFITANSDILMELTDDGGVKAYSMEAGKMTVIRDTVPTQPIPYTYKVKQTNASGQFTLLNHFVPSIPESPTSLPVTYKKASGSLPTTGWGYSGEDTLWEGQYKIPANTSDYQMILPAGSLNFDGLKENKEKSDWLILGSTLSTYSQPYSVYVSEYGIVLKFFSSTTSPAFKIAPDGSLQCNSGGYSAQSFSGLKTTKGVLIYSISDNAITVNSSVKMYLTDEKDIKPYNKVDGSIIVTRSVVPTTAIPYEYEVEQTSAEGLFEVINAYVPDVPDVPTKTSQLENDSGFAKTTEANTFTGEQTFSNENGIKTNRVHNLNGNAWYDFDGTNDRLGSLATPTIIRTSEARPKAEVPSGNSTATKEIALLEDVRSVGDWIIVDDETPQATITEAGTYQVVADHLVVSGSEQITQKWSGEIYFDSLHEARGTSSISYSASSEPNHSLSVYTYTPVITSANNAFLLRVESLLYIIMDSTFTAESIGYVKFKYRKIN